MWIVTEDWKSSDPLEGLELITNADCPLLAVCGELSDTCRPSTLKVGGLITIEGAVTVPIALSSEKLRLMMMERGVWVLMDAPGEVEVQGEVVTSVVGAVDAEAGV